MDLFSGVTFSYHKRINCNVKLAFFGYNKQVMAEILCHVKYRFIYHQRMCHVFYNKFLLFPTNLFLKFGCSLLTFSKISEVFRKTEPKITQSLVRIAAAPPKTFGNLRRFSMVIEEHPNNTINDKRYSDDCRRLKVL